MPLEPGRRLGRYEIRSLLGSGGMGEVYLAQDTKLERKVALKLLLGTAAESGDRLRRFAQEARAASALNHPNIVTVHDVDIEDGTRYITTEFIEGETLRSRLRRGRLPLAEALRIAGQIADALAAAHREGIVHRDIKPENIIVRPDGFVKVVDFGLAKLLEPLSADRDHAEVATRVAHDTDVGTVLGTVAYMSPEQARGLRVDQRTDVWSLGVVLYEMISGQRPFDGPTSSDTIALILHKDPLKLAPLVPEAIGELDVVIDTALTKDAEERYQSAREFLNALKRVRRRLDSDAEGRRSQASDAPMQTPPGGPSIPTPSGRRTVTPPEPAAGASQSSISIITNELKRHPLALVASGVAVLALVGVAGYLVYRQAPHAPALLPFERFKITRLTTSGKVLDAAISPDGRYVVHSVQENNGEGLWLRRVKTDSNINLVPAGPRHYHGLSFSTDGEYIYYSQEDSTASTGTLHQIPVLGGVSRQLVFDVDTNVTFSPDGSRMAFVRGVGRDTYIVIANSDGSNERRLAKLSPPRAFHIDYEDRVGPAWSPDGRSIAVPMEEPHGMVVAVVDTADGSVRVMGAKHWFSMRRVGWLADSSGVLAAVAENAGDYIAHQVWLIPTSGAEPRRITSDLNNYASMSTTTAANAFVVVQISAAANVWIANGADLAAAAPVTSTEASLAGRYGLTWTPDDRLIFFMLSGTGSDLWTMNADGTGKLPLAAGGGFNHHPAASPDGKYIVFISERERRVANLWRVSPDGSHPVQLTTDGAYGLGISPASFSPDGRSITYGFRGRLWRIPVEGGTPTQITNDWSAVPAVSPDGKLIASPYKTTELAPVQLGFFPYEGGKPRRVIDLRPTFALPMRWAPGGRALQLLDTRDDVSNIWNVDPETGAFSQFTHFTSGRIYNFAWSRDGTRLAFSRGGETSDAVLVTDAGP